MACPSILHELLLLCHTRTPRRLGLPIECFRSLLEHREIVLLQVQMFVRHDDDFRSALTLHRFKPLPLFILQQSDDRGMGTDDDPLRLRTASDPADITEYLIGHRSGRLRIASPFAIVTGLGDRT